MKDYDNFFLPIDDINYAKDYYMNTLGLSLKFDFSSQGMVAFKVGDQEPAIILKDKNIFKNIKPTTWFVVDNVDETYNKLMLKGVNFLTKPFKIKTGMAVEFEDPFGNRLGITDYTTVI
ncbi:VOC family protein [Clostridium manihotivorum]|uniref:Lactoylglutathione lyase n=1 Tax=Clostridium manihotivorum TaxID=2320868 RepID=A0A3R5X067_9CLOT|nr:VOC family protein [Clostridium manihotivorum]QAA31034.1 lactoylglutathione lyase [Clostridium manihotivorum]